MKVKIANFLKAYETKIVLILGFILVAVLSFEAGFLQGKKLVESPLIIEKTSQSSEIKAGKSETLNSTKDTIQQEKLTKTDPQTLSQNCTYIGSKNSNKYHLPSCQWAKRIKPENMVCFNSVEDATAKNYQPDKGCIK